MKRLCETKTGYLKIQDQEIQKILKERGLSTQCIQKKNATDCNLMCLAQLCLKINAKMGAINNTVSETNQITRLYKNF